MEKKGTYTFTLSEAVLETAIKRSISDLPLRDLQVLKANFK